jgi:Uncharacterized conserved protein (DUF2358)
MNNFFRINLTVITKGGFLFVFLLTIPILNLDVVNAFQIPTTTTTFHQITNIPLIPSSSSSTYHIPHEIITRRKSYDITTTVALLLPLHRQRNICFNRNLQLYMSSITTSSSSTDDNIISLQVQRKCPFPFLHRRVADNNNNILSTTDTMLSTLQTTTSTTSSSSISTAVTGTATTMLHPWERWYFNMLETRYKQSVKLKCPFFKRRAADILDTADMLMRIVSIPIGHESILPPPSSWRERKFISNTDTVNTSNNLTTGKTTNLSIEHIINILKHDWRIDTNKGYYITGRLSTNIFRDDCYFDGPDPDMPVRGIRKYFNAASQIFEYKTSTATLVSIEAQEPKQQHPTGTTTTTTTTTTTNDTTIVAKWIMSGVLRLPWKPKLPTVYGTTTYYLDQTTNLIYKHIETWDRTAIQAFLETFFPKFAPFIIPSS